MAHRGTSLAESAQIVARWLEDCWIRGLPRSLELETRRCLLNATGAGIGGSADPAASRLVAAGEQAWGHGESPVLGFERRLHPQASALVNAFLVTQNDFDDAHVETIVHPSAAALAGLLAVAATAGVTGHEALTAFALGCETQLAVAAAISPSHYQRGWHTTSTCAALGSAVTAGLLLGLTRDELAIAVQLAILRVVGLRQSHGTLFKGYQVGRGAASGISAVLASRGGIDASAELASSWGKLVRGVTDEPSPRISLPSPGDESSWELLRVTYKAFPAGIVCSSGIEAALRAKASTEVSELVSIRLQVHPLVIELAGNPAPANDMEARVSLPHGVAVALVEGKAGLPEFADGAISKSIVQQVRDRVELVPTPRLPKAAAVLELETQTGVRTWSVDEPLGGPTRPLNDADLASKVTDLVEGVREGASTPVLKAVGDLPTVPSLGQFLAAVTLADPRSRHGE